MNFLLFYNVDSRYRRYVADTCPSTCSPLWQIIVVSTCIYKWKARDLPLNTQVYSILYYLGMDPEVHLCLYYNAKYMHATFLYKSIRISFCNSLSVVLHNMILKKSGHWWSHVIHCNKIIKLASNWNCQTCRS